MTSPRAADIAASASIDVRSERTGIAYRLRVSWPNEPAPASGYAALVALDGDAYFGTVAETARNLSRFGGEIRPTLVVAIGYSDPDRDAWHLRRFLDFTPDAPAPGDPAPQGASFGGLAAFLDWVADALANEVATRWPLDARARVLLGHSLGGLAVTHALLTRPEAFTGYAAVSPALYWGGASIEHAERTFAARVQNGMAMPRVFLAAGGLEDVQRSTQPTSAADERLRREAIAHARIAARTRAFAERLRSVDPTQAFRIRHACPADETHVSVFPAVLASALRHVLPPSRGENTHV